LRAKAASVHRVLDALKERDGAPIAESVKRAVMAYAESKGIVRPVRRGGKRGA
jgi:hypothetical protein